MAKAKVKYTKTTKTYARKKPTQKRCSKCGRFM